MILQESCPDQHICDLGLPGHVLCVCLSRAYGAESPALLRDGLRCSTDDEALLDGVKDVLQVRPGNGLGLVRNIGIAVAECIASAEGLDELMMPGAASCDNVEAVVLGSLDGV